MKRRELSRLGLITVVILTTVLTLLVMYRSKPPTAMMYILGMVAVFLAGLVRWHARRTTYVCPACSRGFQISAITDALHPHTMEAKLLRCPHCGVTNWCPEK